MDAPSLQILHLLLSLFQVLALGSQSVVTIILQHLSAVFVFGILEYFSLEHPHNAHFRQSRIPNLWRLFLSLVCLASLASLGSSNSIFGLFRSFLSYLLAGLGGIDAWGFKCLEEFKVRRVPGNRSPDRLGWKHSEEEKEAHDTLCDQHRLLGIQNLRIRAQSVAIAGQDDLIEKQDAKNYRLEILVQNRDATIDALTAKLGQWKRHRCWISRSGPTALDTLSSNNLFLKIRKLESSIANSRKTNLILVERLQTFEAGSEKESPQPQQPSHRSQQAQIASVNQQFLPFPSQISAEIADAIDSFACYQAHTVSGYGLSLAKVPPMVSEIVHTSQEVQQTHVPLKVPDISTPSAQLLPETRVPSPQPSQAPLGSARTSIPAPVTSAPSALMGIVGGPSQPPISHSQQAAPSNPVRKVKAFKRRVERDMRCNNDDLDDLEFDPSYIPPPIITFTCLCEGMGKLDIQLPADQTFGDVAASWSRQKRDVLKGRSLERIEYGAHEMELAMTAVIQSNALIVAEEKATVNITLKQ